MRTRVHVICVTKVISSHVESAICHCALRPRIISYLGLQNVLMAYNITDKRPFSLSFPRADNGNQKSTVYGVTWLTITWLLPDVCANLSTFCSVRPVLCIVSVNNNRTDGRYTTRPRVIIPMTNIRGSRASDVYTTSRRSCCCWLLVRDFGTAWVVWSNWHCAYRVSGTHVSTWFGLAKDVLKARGDVTMEINWRWRGQSVLEGNVRLQKLQRAELTFEQTD